MLPSVDSLLACRFMADPPRGYSTAIPVSTLLCMLLLPALPTFLPADASMTNRKSVKPLFFFCMCHFNQGCYQLSGISCHTYPKSKLDQHLYTTGWRPKYITGYKLSDTEFAFLHRFQGSSSDKPDNYRLRSITMQAIPCKLIFHGDLTNVSTHLNTKNISYQFFF